MNEGWFVPEGMEAQHREPPARCRSCGAEVLWVITRKQKRMPLDRTGESHFVTCPQAGEWRKR